jgi:hypothetical protein
MPATFPSALSSLITDEAEALYDDAYALSRLPNLPQIVVVGDQDSGKPTVLEALARVRFSLEPEERDKSIVELALKQTKKLQATAATVTINGSPEDFEALEADTGRNGPIKILKVASKGLESLKHQGGPASDVLRVCVEGSRLHPMKLVDIPWFDQFDGKKQPSDNSKGMDELAESYMRQENNIILVVVAASRASSAGPILSKAREFDPYGDRTLGIVTVSESITSHDGDVAQLMRCVNNREPSTKLTLGWHVLFEKTAHEADSQDCESFEDHLFKNVPWSTLPKLHVGVEKLRKKMSEAIFARLRAAIPAGIQSLEEELLTRQKELEHLGPARPTVTDQRKFLLNVASDFRRLALDGVAGRYNHDFFGNIEDESRKIRALIHNLHFAFDHTVRVKGSQSKVFSPEDGAPQPSEYLAAFMERYPYEVAEPEAANIALFLSELQKMAYTNQGTEFLGSPDEALAYHVFQKQVKPWKNIAQLHIRRVLAVTKSFVEELCIHLMGSSTNRKAVEAVLATYVDSFFDDKKESLETKLDEILRPIDRGLVRGFRKKSRQTQFHPQLSGGKRKGDLTIALGSFNDSVLTNWNTEDPDMVVRQLPEMIILDGTVYLYKVGFVNGEYALEPILIAFSRDIAVYSSIM